MLFTTPLKKSIQAWENKSKLYGVLNSWQMSTDSFIQNLQISLPSDSWLLNSGRSHPFTHVMQNQKAVVLGPILQPWQTSFSKNEKQFLNENNSVTMKALSRLRSVKASQFCYTNPLEGSHLPMTQIWGRAMLRAACLASQGLPLAFFSRTSAGTVSFRRNGPEALWSGFHAQLFSFFFFLREKGTKSLLCFSVQKWSA